VVDQIRIALIHARAESVEPARAALLGEMPDADVWSLLDDRLLEDANSAGGLTPGLAARMRRLIDHAVAGGAQGILLTCSLYGPAAQRAAAELDIPVLAADEAAFDAVLGHTGKRIAVVSGQPAPLADSVIRLREHCSSTGTSVDLVPVLADGGGELADRITRAVDAAASDAQVVFLAQYSLSPAASAVQARLGREVVTGPALAAQRLRRLLGQEGGAA
jgi:hypothetical protein